MRTCGKKAAAAHKVHIIEPGPQQHTKIIDAPQVRVGGHSPGQGVLQHLFAHLILRIRQPKHHRGTIRTRAGQMLIHDPQDIQLVRIAHRPGHAGHIGRQGGRQRIAVMQGHGGQRQTPHRPVLTFKASLPLEDGRAPKTVIAGIPVAKRAVAQVLRKAGHIMIQGRQQAGAGDMRRKALFPRHMPGVPQHGAGMLFLEPHGPGIPLTKGILPLHIGGEPHFMRPDVFGVRQRWRFHGQGYTPREA